MAKPTNAKWKSIRIPLRECNQSDSYEKWKTRLTILALLGALAFILVACFLTSERSQVDMFSPGRLSRNHHQLGCAECHVKDGPMTDNVLFAGIKNAGTERWHRKSDQMCIHCHRVLDGSPKDREDRDLIKVPIFAHHPNEKQNEVDSCATCHDEHMGLDSQLTNVPDQTCARCHEDLGSFAIDKPYFNENITSFDVTKSGEASQDTGHPPFRSLGDFAGEARLADADPGTMREFSHQLHMTVGLGMSKTYKDYEYRDPDETLVDFKDDAGMVALDCAFCHKSSGITASSAASGKSAYMSARSLANPEFMTMPTFEKNCKVCHPLSLPTLRTETGDFPHGLKPAEIREKVLDAVTLDTVEQNDLATLKDYLKTGDRKLAENVKKMVEKREVEDTEIAGQTNTLNDKIWDAIQASPKLSAVFEKIRRNVMTAESVLDENCKKCHWKKEEDNKPSDFSQLLSEVVTMPDSETDGEQGQIYKQIWLRHGRFNHFEHRDLKCEMCHDDAYPIRSDDENAVEKMRNRLAKWDNLDIDELANVADIRIKNMYRKSAADNKHILIEGKEKCAKCHQPVENVQRLNQSIDDPTKQYRAAAFNCTYCHTYHGGGNRSSHISGMEKIKNDVNGAEFDD